MALKDLRNDIDEEVSAILASDFKIDVTQTSGVPHFADGTITFPNLDNKYQGTKLLETTVLYIDMRRSTQLSFQHRRETVAKLYSAFVRAMTRAAAHFGGEVRGIIGDRVMAIFDQDKCFSHAADTAFLMNSVCKYIINRRFPHNEVEFGIGIDYGRMLATKTGIARRGGIQQSYRALVWLGRPANIASKLTDNANKAEETIELTRVHVCLNHGTGPFWIYEWPNEFVKSFSKNFLGAGMVRPGFVEHRYETFKYTMRPKTPPILMTEAVYTGLKQERPQANEFKDGWLTVTGLQIPEYSGTIYGCDVIFSVFRDG
jgi:class 3 adenylate cyclase